MRESSCMSAKIICLLNSSATATGMLSGVRVQALMEPGSEHCKSSSDAMAPSMHEMLDVLMLTVAGVGDHQQWDHHGERHRE